MLSNFYDKVARKFGGYGFGRGHVEYISEYTNGDPEKIFKEKLLGLADKNKIALDAGCGDGKFAFQIAKRFLSITGIDLSKELLVIARQKKDTSKVDNVTFKLQDAFKTSFADSSFDIIFSRRGPTPYAESYRLLKKGGYFVEIDIGEQDCRKIKEVFERGQGFGKWKDSSLNQIQKLTQDIGFKIIYAEEFLYKEYYASYKDLDLFLQGVPIFEDFDSERDKEHFSSYVKQNSTSKGIRMERHRVVTVLQRV